MNKLRIGVIGIGNMGSEHCRLLLSGRIAEAELTCVADLRTDRRAWAMTKLPPQVTVYPGGSELIASGRCDAVIVAVPHYGHPALTIEALRHGLHVLCEKPAAVSAGDVAAMAAAARESGRTFALMFNQRTNCIYRRLKQLLDSGELGRLKRVSWTITDWYRAQAYYDSGSWRATWAGEGGGVLLNQCPHQLDLLQWLCGMPTTVRAFCHEGKWHHVEVEDDVTAYLEFPNGATGVFVASTGDLPGVNRLEITCDQGRAVCEDGELRVYTIPERESTYYRHGKSAYPHPEVTVTRPQNDGQNPQHAGVISAFAAHILHGAPLVAEGAEGANSLMLSNAMHLSSWLGKPVSLPIDTALFDRLLAGKRAASRLKDVQDVTFVTDHSATGRAL